MASTKVGHFLARLLGIKIINRDSNIEDLTRGESIFSNQSANTFVETEPTTIEWVREVLPGGRDVVQYARSLFPFTYWIGRYNLQWLLGDLVAGRFTIPCCFGWIIT